MNSRLLSLLLLAATWCAAPVAASWVGIDDPAPESARGMDVDGASDSLEGRGESALLRRWNRLTPTEQGRLRERFEHFKKIEASERERLAKRGKRLDLLARQLYRELPEVDRERVDAMSAVTRREIMREMAADKARDVGRRIHDKFPAQLRQRLEAARPEDRARFLDEFRVAQREHMGEVLVRLGEELQIDAAVIKRIIRLPDDQRGRKLLEFLQRRASVEVGRRGLPPGVTIEQWQAIWELPGDEFFEAIMALREAHPTLAMPPSTATQSAEQTTTEAELRKALELRLSRAARPLPSDRIELSDWLPGDRRKEILHRRRERVEAVLFDEHLLSPDQKQELAILPDSDFLIEVRRLL